MEEQWAVRVNRKQAEEKRQELICQKMLDRRLKPVHDGEGVLLPVLEPVEGMLRHLFESHDERIPLPRHELIGGIAIMQDRDPLQARILLASRPSLHTVLFPTSDVEGVYRTRRFEVLAGDPTTRTVIHEHGHRFEIDLEEAYFSARLATERQRVLGMVRDGEQVLDMFAGVGPFAIILAEKADFIVAADINPAAVLMMRHNLARNRTENVLPILSDAAHLASILPWGFDRVVMNHPTGAIHFIDHAVRLCAPGGTIHLYALQSAEGELLPRILNLPLGVRDEHTVRSYAPGKWHAVYDLELKKRAPHI